MNQVGFRPLVAKVMQGSSANGGALTRLADFTVRSPKLVLAVLALLLGVSIVIGGGVSDKLAVGGYNAPPFAELPCITLATRGRNPT